MLPFALIPFLVAAAQAEEPPKPITVTGYRWAPFLSPMGEPFRSRTPDDDPFARWFHQADGDHDGMLTADEMRADAERFFAALDVDRDGRIDSEERMAYESKIAPEVQVNSDWKRTREEAAAEARSGDDSDRDHRRQRWPNEIDGYQLDGLQGAARYGLLNLPEPVAGADANFDRFVSLDEFRRAASYRFQLLDRDRSGRLTLKNLEVLLPSRPKEGRRVKRPKNAVDTRIGLPLPEGD
jgi:Ca2+-binding EF-hand superfamily protein